MGASTCCKVCCCFLGLIGLSIVIAAYFIMLYTSPCYKGCVGTNCKSDDSGCFLSCISPCWKTHLAKCPKDGLEVCIYLGMDKVNNIFAG